MKEVLKTLEEIAPQESEELARLATGAGLDPAAIKVEHLATAWARNCLIVELHIGRARFERALTPPDLGLDKKELKEYIETLYPGRQLLIAGEYKELYQRLASIEQRARRVVKRYSLETEFGHAVSCIRKNGQSPFEKMTEELKKLEAEYSATHAELVTKLDEISAYMEKIMNNAAGKIWRASHSNTSLEEFRKSFVAKAMSNFPDRTHVESMYCFRLIPKFVPLTGANDIQHSAMQLKHEIVESIRQSYQEQVEGFIHGILTQLHEIIYDSVNMALEALRKTGTLPGPTLLSLKNTIEQVKNLNFGNDQAVIKQVEQLEKALEGQKHNEKTLGLVLEELQEENRHFLEILGNKPRTVRTLPEITQSQIQPVQRKKRRLAEQQSVFS